MMSRSWKAPDWEKNPARAAGNPPPHLAKSQERSQGGNGQICKGCNESRARSRFFQREEQAGGDGSCLSTFAAGSTLQQVQDVSILFG